MACDSLLWGAQHLISSDAAGRAWNVICDLIKFHLSHLPECRCGVLLNASALSGVIIFTVANIMGMNLGTAPGSPAVATASFNDMSFSLRYPLFLTVRYFPLCTTLRCDCYHHQALHDIGKTS